MSAIFTHWLLGELYLPQGYCYLWQTPLVLLHALSDSLMAVAYLTILSFIIYSINKQQENISFRNFLALLSAFMILCGINHLLEVLTLWYSLHWLSGIIKAVTALISLYTVLQLIPLIPRVLNLPSAEKAESLNRQLKARIVECQAAEAEIRQLNLALEQQVIQKTKALEEINRANESLQKSTKFKQKITDLTPNLLYIYDLENENYIYCNRFIEELLSHSASQERQLSRSLFAKLLHPGDLELVEQHHQNLMTLEEGDFLEIEYRMKDKRGAWHWLHSKDTVFERQADGTPKQIFGITQDITTNKKIQLELESLNLLLRHKIQALETSNQERIKLGKINEFLQACLTIEEVQKALSDLLKPLFPNTNGAVYLINNSKNFVEAIATWGSIDSDHSFTPEECWALRRSKLHQSEPTCPGVYCEHVSLDVRELHPTMCIPMMAQGETLGLLYLSERATDAGIETATPSKIEATRRERESTLEAKEVTSTSEREIASTSLLVEDSVRQLERLRSLTAAKKRLEAGKLDLSDSFLATSFWELQEMEKALFPGDRSWSRVGNNNTATNLSAVRELGETVAQNLAMSLANLKLQETLRYQSFRDPLTGLYNRRYLEETLSKEIERARRKQHYIGVMILDIDHFKRFNDTYGHDAGDLVLQSVSQYLRQQTRQYDIVCRYGGEELIAIMPEAAVENMIIRAEGIREGIKNLEIIYEGKQLESVTVSIGISCFPDDGLESNALLKAADRALYRAKQQGRDRVTRC